MGLGGRPRGVWSPTRSFLQDSALPSRTFFLFLFSFFLCIVTLSCEARCRLFFCIFFSLCEMVTREWWTKNPSLHTIQIEDIPIKNARLYVSFGQHSALWRVFIPIGTRKRTMKSAYKKVASGSNLSNQLMDSFLLLN
jgi:hypothetical protein